MGNSGTKPGELEPNEYRELIAHTSDVVTVVDEDGTIRYQSPSSERIKGWSPEELHGENVLDYVHPEDREDVVEQFGSLTGEAGPIEKEIEFRFRAKDGEWIWLAVRGTRPGPESPLDGYITTSRNISYRIDYQKRLEEQLDALGILNQVLRHDIRNDLQVISAYAELLADEVDTEGQEYAGIIQQKTEHAADLTRTARDMADAMLTTDEEREAVNIRAVLEREIDELRSTYPEAAITVGGTIPPVSVLADDMLDSVVRNMLKNAVQHNDKAVPEVRVSVSTDDGSVLVRVGDNGPGIPDDRKTEIFGKGEKGFDSDGTGLGLYLVRTLVETYGGGIRVEDNDPEGSVFVLELPAAD